MKPILAFLFSVMTALSVFAWQQEPPANFDFCTPSHLHNKCECLAMGGYKECKDGVRETETQKCMAYCKKDSCRCCASVKR